MNRPLKIFLFASLGISSVTARAASLFPTFDYQKFSVNLSSSICAAYPTGKKLTVPLAEKNSGGESQDLFYFFMNEYRADLPTMLVLPGGPGVVIAPKQNLHPEFANDFNLLTYHPRGAGCSSYPMTDAGDANINLQNEIADIETIRRDLHLKQWAVIYGTSAGTGIGRAYAGAHPNRVKKIVLEGIQGVEQEAEKEVRLDTFAEDTWKEFLSEQRGNLLSRLSDAQVKKMGERFVDQFKNRSEAFTYLAVQGLLKQEFLDASWSEASPSFLIKMLPVILTYYGKDKVMNHLMITEFVRYWSGANLDLAEDMTNIHQTPKSIKTALFSSLAVDDFGELPYKLSWRIMYLLRTATPISSTCYPADQLLIQGGADMATPEKAAKEIFKNKNCQKGATRMIVNHKAGHWSIVTPTCHHDLIVEFVKAQGQPKNIPVSCKDDKITVQTR